MSKVQTQSEWEWQAANDIFKFIKNELYMELRFFDVPVQDLLHECNLLRMYHLLYHNHHQLIQCQLMAILFILSRSI